VHGQPQRLNVGSLAVVLYPLYHPAAALYTPAMFKVLEEDFARLPELLGAPVPEPAPSPVPLLAPVAAEPAAVQLGLF
jgi:DNA polymerase